MQWCLPDKSLWGRQPKIGALTERPLSERPSNVSTPSKRPPITISKCSLRPLWHLISRFVHPWTLHFEHFLWRNVTTEHSVHSIFGQPNRATFCPMVTFQQGQFYVHIKKIKTSWKRKKQHMQLSPFYLQYMSNKQLNRTWNLSCLTVGRSQNSNKIYDRVEIYGKKQKCTNTSSSPSSKIMMTHRIGDKLKRITRMWQ